MPPQAVTVPALTSVTGSQEAAQTVVDALGDMKRYADGRIDTLKAAHNQQLAAVRRQGEAKLEAAQMLKHQLMEARKAATEQSALRQRLATCAYASHLLATALKPD